MIWWEICVLQPRLSWVRCMSFQPCHTGCLGLARILYMDIQKELINGTLVEVLPDWHMPAYTLHALTSKREQYPMKVHRCIDALKQYFVQLPGGRSLQGVA